MRAQHPTPDGATGSLTSARSFRSEIGTPGGSCASDALLSIEAMKMETTVYSQRTGMVTDVFANVGVTVETKDLLVIVNEPGPE